MNEYYMSSRKAAKQCDEIEQKVTLFGIFLNASSHLNHIQRNNGHRNQYLNLTYLIFNLVRLAVRMHG